MGGQGVVGEGGWVEDVMVNRTAVKEAEDLCEMIVGMYEDEFSDDLKHSVDQVDSSPEDRKFMELLEERTEHRDGHFVVPLPVKNSDLVLPNNRAQAVQRAVGQGRKMMKSEEYRRKYIQNL